ncbi:MAG TPA: sterol desaturase family protein [Bacteroidota bacterium]|nr:sterol desaturase family protein [Bacteroidota bacterium]
MAKLFVSNKDQSARLFQSSFLELFTHVHWSVPIIVYFPLVVYCLAVAPAQGPLSTAGIVMEFVAGLFVWTLTEYLLHRFVFHYEPTTSWGKRLHFLMHGVHHDYPQDSKRLVMPPVVSIPLATLFLGLFWVILPEGHVASTFAGFIFGYICYDEIHYATHHAPMKGKVGLWLKHHHVRHHYLDPGRGYGVSSPIWDYVFGTMYGEKEEISMDEKTA